MLTQSILIESLYFKVIFHGRAFFKNVFHFVSLNLIKLINGCCKLYVIYYLQVYNFSGWLQLKPKDVHIQYEGHKSKICKTPNHTQEFFMLWQPSDEVHKSRHAKDLLNFGHVQAFFIRAATTEKVLIKSICAAQNRTCKTHYSSTKASGSLKKKDLAPGCPKQGHYRICYINM